MARRHSGGREVSVGAPGVRLTRGMMVLSETGEIGERIHVTRHVNTPQYTEMKCQETFISQEENKIQSHSTYILSADFR